MIHFFMRAVAVFDLFFLSLVLFGCSGLEKSEQEKIRKNNARSEPILRVEGERFYEIRFPDRKDREPYPWELSDSANNSSKE